MSLVATSGCNLEDRHTGDTTVCIFDEDGERVELVETGIRAWVVYDRRATELRLPETRCDPTRVLKVEDMSTGDRMLIGYGAETRDGKDITPSTGLEDGAEIELDVKYGGLHSPSFAVADDNGFILALGFGHSRYDSGGLLNGLEVRPGERYGEGWDVDCNGVAQERTVMFEGESKATLRVGERAVVETYPGPRRVMNVASTQITQTDCFDYNGGISWMVWREE